MLSSRVRCWLYWCFSWNILALLVQYHCCWPSGGRLNIKMASYQYRNSHVKDKTVSPTVLSLTWESPYMGKTVFILRRGPGSLWCQVIHIHCINSVRWVGWHKEGFHLPAQSHGWRIDRKCKYICIFQYIVYMLRSKCRALASQSAKITQRLM